MKLELLLHILTLSSLYYMRQIDMEVTNQILVTADSSSSSIINVAGVGSDIVSVNLLSATSVHGGTVMQDIPGSSIITYIPASGYVGQDSFQFTVINSFGVTSLPITALISVLPLAPQAYAKSVNTLASISMRIKLCGCDAAGEALIFSLATLPLHGIVSGLPCSSIDGSVIATYTPQFGYTGQDTFEFIVTNASGVISDVAQVTICIACNPSSGSQGSFLNNMVAKYAGM